MRRLKLATMATPDREAIEPQPDARIRFAIEAALKELAPASARIRSFFIAHGVDKTAIFAIETVIEELATNAIKYAFHPSTEGRITLEASATTSRAELIIEDNGNPFNPTEAPDPEVNRSLEDMPIGGLGIHLVRELTDGFDYKRINNRNHVHVWVERER
jgi:anti-sigma regulatory factor (Ser/Thr protein kinase)